MNSKGEVKTDRIVPHFDNEADEARWWFENKESIEQDFETAFANGTIGRGRSLNYAVAAAKPADAVTLYPEDAALARELASHRGESYEDYVRKVMHRALLLEKTA